jgi:hypothetical protein
MATPAAIDPKARAMAASYHRHIRSGTYTESDVFGLIILVRERAPQGSALREFGDFIAHRARTRGPTLKYVTDFATFAVRARQAALQGSNLEETFVPAPVFTLDETGASVNTVLADFGLSPLRSLEVEALTLCLISILQNARIVTDPTRPEGDPLDDEAHLELSYSQDRVTLLCKLRVSVGPLIGPVVRPWWVFEALSVPNRGYVTYDPSRAARMPGDRPGDPDQPSPEIIGDRLYTAVSEGGRLQLVAEATLG